MKKLFMISTSFLLGVIAIVAFAQQAANDFYLINKAYQAHDHMVVNMNIRAYKTWTDKVPYEEKKCEIKKSKALRYTNVGEFETIVNRNYSVTVDHGTKQIFLLAARIDDMPFREQEMLMPKLDSVLLKLCKKVEFKKETNGMHSYVFNMYKGDYEKLKIVYSPKTYLLQKVIFYYNTAQQFDEKGPETKPRLEIDYVKVEFPKTISTQEFTYDRYLVKQANGKLICRPQYKSYELINQL